MNRFYSAIVDVTSWKNYDCSNRNIPWLIVTESSSFLTFTYSWSCCKYMFETWHTKKKRKWNKEKKTWITQTRWLSFDCILNYSRSLHAVQTLEPILRQYIYRNNSARYDSRKYLIQKFPSSIWWLPVRKLTILHELPFPASG